jgi:CPA2 family monovalent cation:H+ antiporter-2
LERILEHVGHVNPTLSTLVSARDDRDLDAIVRAGASVVYPENLAAGLALASQALVLCGLREDKASEFVMKSRAALSSELTVQGTV